MKAQLVQLHDAHVQSVALRLCRLAAGNRQLTEDHLLLACATDPVLRMTCEQIGRRKLAKDAAVKFDAIVETAGLFTASHPG